MDVRQTIYSQTRQYAGPTVHVLCVVQLLILAIATACLQTFIPRRIVLMPLGEELRND